MRNYLKCGICDARVEEISIAKDDEGITQVRPLFPEPPLIKLQPCGHVLGDPVTVRYEEPRG